MVEVFGQGWSSALHTILLKLLLQLHLVLLVLSVFLLILFLDQIAQNNLSSGLFKKRRHLLALRVVSNAFPWYRYFESTFAGDDSWV